jgi:hypothetical protein
MSRQLRYRVAAIVLGGLLLGGPLLTSGTASAGQVEAEAAGRQVTFAGGGMLGLSCRSQPDVESMVVPANSTVRVVNRTGYSARLQLGGATKGTLADDAATEVVFRRGTTAVLLTPNCALGEDAEPVLVTASPSAPVAAPATGSMPDPIPVPSGPGSSALAAGSSDASPPAGSVLPGAVSPAGRPSGVHRTTIRPGGDRPSSLRSSAAIAQAATTAARAMPQGGDTSQATIRSRATGGTHGGTAPAFAGMPPGAKRALVPAVPQGDLAPAAADAAPAAPTVAPTEVAAAEQVATVEPMRDRAPVGLLALIAAVCILGVGTASIRAIVSQRANRSLMA